MRTQGEIFWTIKHASELGAQIFRSRSNRPHWINLSSLFDDSLWRLAILRHCRKNTANPLELKQWKQKEARRITAVDLQEPGSLSR